MAQLVERVLGKDEVGGSNPPSSSRNRQTLIKGLSILLIITFYYLKMWSTYEKN